MNIHVVRTFCIYKKMNKLNKILVRNHNTFRSISIPLTKIDRVQQDEKVLGPLKYIHRSPSKYHFDLFRSFNYWMNAPEEKYKALEEVLRIVISATLLIDDIQDNSTLRHKVPAAHTVYSSALTINAAFHALSLALEKILTLEPKALHIVVEAFIEANRGQGIDIYWRDNLLCPSEEEYRDMIEQKTSVMFILVCRLLKLFSEEKTDYTKLANLIGIYYQIRDDYSNLLTEKSTENNAYCSDITEGKFSLPIIHAIKNSDRADQVLNILKQRTRDLDLKAYCVSILKSIGSFEYTREVLIGLESDINYEIQNLGGNPELTRVMNKLGSWKQYNINEK